VLTVRSKEINNSANVVLCIDGESVMTLSGQDSVTVTKADTTMEFISLTGNSFCDMLNTKLLERR
jgi:NAD kinase